MRSSHGVLQRTISALRGPLSNATVSYIFSSMSAVSKQTSPAVRVGPALAGSLVASMCAAHAVERSGRLTADVGPAAGLLAAVRFTRSLVVTAAVILDYRVLFGKFDNYASAEYKEARSRTHERCAYRILELCKTQGAVYVKIGQHVASMNHAVPKEYTSAFKELEDRASYRPYHQVRRVLCSELGGSVHDHFANFETVPVAAASLAQVHRAHLRDGGEKVAVKVQYPGLEALVAGDLASIRVLSRLLSYVFPYFSLDWMVREFRVNLAKELDFLQEAESAEHSLPMMTVLQYREYSHDNQREGC
jgi:ABC1 atypical kinase-like domain